MFTIKEKTPKDGYLFPLWEQKGYRATAIAYLKRNDLYTIENTNGRWYTLTQLQNSLVR